MGKMDLRFLLQRVSLKLIKKNNMNKMISEVTFLEVLKVTMRKYWKLLVIASLIFLVGLLGLVFVREKLQSNLVSITFINIASVFCLFFVGLGIVIFYGFIKNLVLFTYNLLNYGKRTEGKIISFEEDALNSELKSIKFEYSVVGEKIYTSLSGNLKKEIYDSLEVNQLGEISYDDKKPQSSIWIGEDWRKFIL